MSEDNEQPPAPEEAETVVDKINLDGRSYETVASRMRRFRDKHADYFVHSTPLVIDDEKVRIQCDIGFYSVDGRECILAQGHAEEYRRDGTEVNETSAVENCETSAIGRALFAMGFGGSDSGFASAEDMRRAKKAKETNDKHLPGALVLLQNAAKNGTDALKVAWSNLQNADRAACHSFMPKLKKQAAEVNVPQEASSGFGA